MIDKIANSSRLIQGFFVMVAGIIGVFIVLTLLFFLMKILLKLLPEKVEEKQEET